MWEVLELDNVVGMGVEIAVLWLVVWWGCL